MSGNLRLVSSEAARLRMALAVNEAHAEITAPRAGPLGGDALAAEAEALAMALMQQARVALSVSGRVADCPARHAELGSAVKLAHAAAAVTQALDRRQGKGTTQRVIVEKIEVQGGQNIIGAVASPGGGARSQGDDR